MTRDLKVWMNGRLVGTWSMPRGGGHMFTYDEEWVASKRAVPLSLSMPITPDREIRGAVVENYFDNLLPDNEDIRKRIQGRYRTGSIDAFDLLSAIGRDCVGAVQLLPDGKQPQGYDEVRASPLSEAQVARLLRDVVVPGAYGADLGEFRISIAGAQEKTALLWHRGRWCLPQGATPTTHILKLPLGVLRGRGLDMTHSVENEWLCLKILGSASLPAAQAGIGTFEDQKALIVKRFDRLAIDPKGVAPWILRRPQEDLCQVFGKPPRMKYESDGGPGVEHCLEVLNGSSQRRADRGIFIAAQMMFWVLAAIDGHAKNFSIYLEPDNQYQLTPLYDVLSAWPVIGNGRGKLAIQNAKLAMAIRGRNAHRVLQDIQARHWRRLVDAHAPGEWDAFVAWIEAIRRHIDNVLQELPEGFPEHVATSIATGARKQVERFMIGANQAADAM